MRDGRGGLRLRSDQARSGASAGRAAARRVAAGDARIRDRPLRPQHGAGVPPAHRDRHGGLQGTEVSQRSEAAVRRRSLSAEACLEGSRGGRAVWAAGGEGVELKSYVSLARPFTLLPPLFGIISGAICAWGSAHNPDPSRTLTVSVVMTVVLGSLCASFLNAASNAINQIYDLEIDRINKPNRPLCTGELTIKQAWGFTWLLYALAIVPTWWVVVFPYTTWGQKFAAPLPAHECFFIYIAGMIFTFVYSAPALGR